MKKHSVMIKVMKNVQRIVKLKIRIVLCIFRGKNLFHKFPFVEEGEYNDFQIVQIAANL